MTPASQSATGAPMGYPASSLQRQFWFAQQLDAGGSANTIASGFILRGQFNPGIFADCLRSAVRRHAILRTVYELRDGSVWATIQPDAAIDLREYRLEKPDDDNARKILANEAARPFDLASGPVVRLAVISAAQPDWHAIGLVFHHIAVDYRTKEILSAEISADYNHRASGAPEPAHAPSPSYEEFARRENEWLSSPAAAKALETWQSLLAGKSLDLPLPIDNPRQTSPSYRGDLVEFRLDASLCRELDQFCEAQATTPYVALLAAYFALLRLYSNCGDFAVGAPLTNRRQKDFESTTGCCVNILPLAVEQKPSDTYNTIVRKVRRSLLDAHRIQEMPFERLVAASGRARSHDRSPLHQIGFTAGAPMSLKLDGVEIDAFHCPNGGAQLDLFLWHWSTPTGITAQLHYNTALFKRQTATAIASDFVSLLQAALRAPDRTLAEPGFTPRIQPTAVPTASGEPASTAETDPSKRHKLLVDWNDTARAGSTRPVHRMFEEQASRSSGQVAVVFGKRSLTYGQLDQRANKVAHLLRSRGVETGDLVGICLARSEEMLATLLGIWKAGAAYVPLDPIYPPDRIAYVLQDARAKLLITEENLSQTIDSSTTPHLLIDREKHALESQSHEPPGIDSKPGDAAYVIYTSGSTGKPKGVLIEHHALANFLISMLRQPGLHAGDALLAVTTLSFDIAGLELFLPLVAGARVVIAPWGATTDGRELIAALERDNITLMQATPVTWRLMLESGWTGRSTLRILCGGEPLPRDLAASLLPRCAELWNMYGPTETTIWSTCSRVTDPNTIHIGRPIDNTQIYIVDANREPVPVGQVGELFIGGDGLARGYFNRPELTAEKFIPSPFKPGARIYATGDLARYRPDGNIECLGRSDFQVKIRGFRIELGEIESAITTNSDIKQAVAIVREDKPGDKQIVAYLRIRDGANVRPETLREQLRIALPEYMVPAAFVVLQEFPHTPNGKVDRKALPAPESPRTEAPKFDPAKASSLEREIAAIWSSTLNRTNFALDSNFFDLGGHSLLLVKVQNEIKRRLNIDLPVVTLFQFPTIAGLCKHIAPPPKEQAPAKTRRRQPKTERESIAIIGMAGRFPDATSCDEFWANLKAGKNSVRFFTKEELESSGFDIAGLTPEHIAARPILDDVDLFDAPFFGFTHKEAEMMDPQHRLMLETAWTALENAGYDPGRVPGPVGVFAGSNPNTYLATNLQSHPELLDVFGHLPTWILNGNDFLATRLSYKLNLKGPSLTLQTACSTSLVAISQACQSLLAYQCDLALAGAVAVSTPVKRAYEYSEGGIFSSDGHCRPFDASASGTVFGDGLGVIVLRRLSDAIEAGDNILAVIKGCAINNDGSDKTGFTAPSVNGQASVIETAHALAGVPARSIAYIEAHGTATPLGDPIEVSALTQAFRQSTLDNGFCAIGSVKSNIGHLDAAAGMAGVIKSVLALQNRQIPPSINFSKPNPKIDFANTPFFVADRLRDWPPGAEPRRAGVSSFGIGGTNVHIVLEEAPATAPDARPSRETQLIVVSARTPAALEKYSHKLADYFASCTASAFPDAASTLALGRKPFACRHHLVARSPAEAATLLRQSKLSAHTALDARLTPSTVFMFGGQGAQYVGMGASLYRSEPVFKDAIDQCSEILLPLLGRDLRELLYPTTTDKETATQTLRDTLYAQPAIFTVEYALASWWRHLGVEPAAMVGHSIGEFVAATLAGVFKLADALKVVSKRGRLMQNLPRGSMLSVRGPAAEVEKLLPPELQLAAVNSPNLCVVAGPSSTIAEIQSIFEARGWPSRELHTSHAFHSAMMDPILPELKEVLCSVQLNKPASRIISTVTGATLTDEQACNPEYWTGHARNTVRFSQAMQVLLDDGHTVFLECGPRTTLCTLARQHSHDIHAIPSLEEPSADGSELAIIQNAVGALWSRGLTINWEAYFKNEIRRRTPVPTYPFERQSYWINPNSNHSLRLPARTGLTATVRLEAAPPPENELPTTTKVIGTSSARKKSLTAILAKITGGRPESLRTDSSFFELGLDSLALIQFTTAIRNSLGVRIPFSQLTKQFATIDALADHLESSAEKTVPPPAANDGKTGTESPRQLEVPATLPQRGIFHSSKLSGQLSSSYNLSMSVRFTGTIDMDRLAGAIRQLAVRHDALRATFDDDGLTMRLLSEHAPSIEVVDITGLNPQDRTAREVAVAAKECATPFPLATGPLFRAVIVRHDKDRATVVLTAHHVVCDGWGLNILVRDLCGLYSKELGGEARLPEPAPSYGEYARLCHNRSLSPIFSAARQYYESRFSEGFPVLALPTDRPRPKKRSFAANQQDIAIPAATVKSLRALASQHGCGFFAIAVAAYSLQLARISGLRRFVIALPTAEQPVLGMPDLVGHCINMLPLEVDLRAEKTLAAFLSETQRQLSESYDHTAYSLAHIFDRLRPVKQHIGIRPISVGLTSVKKPRDTDIPKHGFEVDFDANPPQFESFEFYLMVVERADDILLRCTYDTELFDAHTAGTWLRELAGLLSALPDSSNASTGKILMQRNPAAPVSPEVPFVLGPEAAEHGAAGTTSAEEKLGDRAKTLTQESLTRLWEVLLGVERIDADGDFFELGGHSLLAADMFVRIKKEFGINAPLSLLFDASTPAKLFRALKSDAGLEWQAWTPIVSKGDRVPIILAHGAEGNVLLYREVAKQLQPGQPVFGLQCKGLDGRGGHHERIEDMARDYVSAINKHYPTGPLILGGYCLGGTLSLEMARQFKELGRPVALIIMIESYSHIGCGAKETRLLALCQTIQNLWYHTDNLVRAMRRGEGRGAFLRNKFQVEVSRFKTKLKISWAGVVRLLGVKNSEDYPHFRLSEINDRAYFNYTPAQHDGAIAVIRPEKQFAGYNHPCCGWDKFVSGPIDVHVLPVSPRGMLVAPFSADLARAIRKAVDTALARRS